MFKRKKVALKEVGEKREKVELLRASERYIQANEPQLERYIKAIADAAKRGEESCYLEAGGNHPMRKHHIATLLEQGYDIKETHFQEEIIGESWFYECFWREDASGKFIIKKK